jgi:hypothetical protein
MTDCYRLDVVQGADLRVRFQWNRSDGSPVDLSDYSPFSQIRTAPGGDLILDLTPFFVKEPDGITGALDLIVPGGETRNVDRSGVWDLFLIGGAEPDVKLLTGDTTIELAVTGSAAETVAA